MKQLLLLIFTTASLLTSSQTIYAQTVPAIQWDKTIGGTNWDVLNSLQQTTDGGYILGGTSQSPVSGHKSQPSRGYTDYWVIKLNASGVKTWDKTYGGNSSEELKVVKQTTDGGYILGGNSVSGVSGERTQPSRGIGDFWIVKINALGNKQWDKAFGGPNNDNLFDLCQTSDGGYLLGGYSESGVSVDKSEPNKGMKDFWIVKTDANGNKQWDKTFGGNDEDWMYSLQQTSDGGYILGGFSESGISGDKSQPVSGPTDAWIIKIDASGNKVWDKTFGGTGVDALMSIKQTTDGGYILGATSDSPISGDKSEHSKGNYDFWILKLDTSGNKIWDRTIGGNNGDRTATIIQTIDGGYLLGGYSDSDISGDKSQGSKGWIDYWVVKFDPLGVKNWDLTLGGSNPDISRDCKQTADGGFICGGQSQSDITGDKTEGNLGGEDYWIVKLGPEILGLPETLNTNLTLYPNPTTGLINLELKDQQPTQISIYNSLGQTILTKTEAQSNQDGKLQLDLSNQAKGIYTVQVISGNQSAVSKVVLQ